MRVMAVDRVDVPVGEFRALGVRIRNPAGHRPREQFVEGGDFGEPPQPFEGFEEMAALDVGDAQVGMIDCLG